jgi:hypothetical protein
MIFIFCLYLCGSYKYIMDFPNEISEIIVSFVSPHDLNNYEMTCKKEYFNPHQNVWKKFLHRDLSNLKCKLKISSIYNNTDYKRTYRELIIPIRKTLIYPECSSSIDLMKRISQTEFPQTEYNWFKLIHYSISLAGIKPINYIDIKLWIKNQRQIVLRENTFEFKCTLEAWRIILSYRHKYDLMRYHMGAEKADFTKRFHKESDFHQQTMKLIADELTSI